MQSLLDTVLSCLQPWRSLTKDLWLKFNKKRENGKENPHLGLKYYHIFKFCRTQKSVHAFPTVHGAARWWVTTDWNTASQCFWSPLFIFLHVLYCALWPDKALVFPPRSWLTCRSALILFLHGNYSLSAHYSAENIIFNWE